MESIKGTTSMTAVAKLPTVDELAQEIRRVDGNHSLGAGALAEALMPFLAALSPAELGGRKCRFCGCAEDPGTAPDPYTTDGTVEVCPQCNEGESYITTTRAAEAVTEEVFAIVRPYLQPEAREKVRAALTASLTPPSAKGE